MKRKSGVDDDDSLIADKTSNFPHTKNSIHLETHEGNSNNLSCLFTDEDSYPSSGSESRESSAGSVRTRHQCPPPLETQNITRRLLQRQNLNASHLSSLELEIPAAGKYVCCFIYIECVSICCPCA